MGKRALITGITGMVGSHLADYLLEKTDWEIHGMCRWRSNLENIEHLIPSINKGDRLFLQYADLTDGISLRKAITKSKPDYVFHLAAQSFPTTSFSSPLETINTNVLGTVRLLDCVKDFRDAGLIDPLIHVCSSSEVFGRVPREKVPIDEDSAFHPASPYAISKTGADLVGRFYAEAYGLKTLVTRMFTHTGPRRGDVFVESSFAKQIALIEARQSDSVVMVGNLDSMRTWADVRDAVNAYYLLVTKDPEPGECYNIGGNYSCTVKAMLDYLLSISTAKDVAIQSDPARIRPIDADVQIPDVRKFKKKTGWEPQIPFEKTMKDLLDYWRAKVKSGRLYLRNR